VPSPKPQSVVQSAIIHRLVDEGVIVVCCGGGGIPVFKLRDGCFEGFDAVIDKDRASAMLAAEIHADLLLILTQVDRVALDFATDHARSLDTLTAKEAARHLADGQFPKGSMGPKIEAALDFLGHGGKEVIITSIPKALDAVEGRAGTRIVP